MRGAIPPCTLPQTERPRAFDGPTSRPDNGCRGPPGVGGAWPGRAEPGREPLVVIACVRGVSVADQARWWIPTTSGVGLARLADDLRSGRWEARHGALRECESLDLGYRLVVAERA
jgi:hypothetical protein